MAHEPVHQSGRAGCFQLARSLSRPPGDLRHSNVCFLGSWRSAKGRSLSQQKWADVFEMLPRLDRIQPSAPTRDRHAARSPRCRAGSCRNVVQVFRSAPLPQRPVSQSVSQSIAVKIAAASACSWQTPPVGDSAACITRRSRPNTGPIPDLQCHPLARFGVRTRSPLGTR